MLSTLRNRSLNFLPGAALALGVAGILWYADTTVTEIARYAAYVVWALVLPGTLIYRSLGRATK